MTAQILHGRNASILIVEDNVAEATLLTRRLQRRNYHACGVVSTGEEAIEAAMLQEPDIVLMDIRLAGQMDGIEAAGIITARYGIPCIFVTAHDDDDTLQRASIIDSHGYLLKPFSDRELFSTIEISLYKQQMEKELHEKQQWLGTTLRSIGDAVIATDTSEYIRFMNPVAEQLTGWTQADALGRALTDVFRIEQEESHRSIESPASIVLRTGVAVGLANHTTLIRRDGGEIPIEDCASPIKDDKGATAGVVLVFRDVTERKRATRALQRSEEHYRLLFERNLAGVFKATTTGQLLDCNEAFARMLGYERREDAVFHSEMDWFVSAEDRRAFLTQVRNDRFIFNEETHLRRVDGTLAWVIQNVTWVEDADLGAVIHGTVIDITDRKQMEIELRLAKERAEQSDKLKASILANMSHEIRTPLNIILGYAGVIRSVLGEKVDAGDLELFAQLDAGAKRLTRTVENVINTSKIQAGMYVFHPEILDVNAELDHLVREMQHLAEQKGIEMTYNTREPVFINADRYALDQAFINLIDNAIKFTKEGRVTLELLVDAGEARVQVRDTGIGISSEYLGQVFLEFSQETTGFTRSYEGLGLGLPLSRKYIEGNGGRIEVDSRKGVGTVFTVSFPCIDTSAHRFELAN